ncbi:DUF2407 C-terminal domain-containing protein [Crassisporium funariophilum]|nr:DUF2407 C-terminal domain-containing protein [Crassisporium funariophilum]
MRYPDILSEKAKGKQRAVETPIDPSGGQTSASAAQAEETPRNLVIRFTEGALDLTISVDKDDSVRDVKGKIREARPELHDRRLRLIHAGRMLSDGTFLYLWLLSLEERQQRANADDGLSAPNSKTTWIHCSVGPTMEAGEAEADDTNVQAAQIQPVRGFDRLASVGFSQEDIENFRRQFHSQSSSNYLDVDFETEEEYDEHARALEEQWIDSIDNAGSASLSQSASSSSASVLQGVLLGFFFPFMPFFFMRNQKPAAFWEDGNEQEPTSNVIFSRRMQMGLVVGFLVNVLFGMWRFLLDSS